MSQKRVLDIFREALRHPSDERAGFLDSACSDPDVRREVEVLLAADASTDEGVLGLSRFAPSAPVHSSPEDSFLGPTGTEGRDARVGERVGRYVIERKLGAGGMGIVYVARDSRLERRVALKFLPAYRRTDDEAKARFIREAQAASALDHPGICTVYEVDETEEGELYIAMAYYEGQTLAQRMRQERLPLDEALDVLQQTAEALARAHEAGIVHRDVKPSNLMLTTQGTVKVLDFGVAKLAGREGLTREGDLLGTIAYMAPEQARGDPVDHRVDVWALGVVTYEMMTGVRPFKRDTYLATLHAVQHEEAPPLRSLRPGVPSGVQDLVAWMLEKDPAERCPSLRALGDVAELSPTRRAPGMAWIRAAVSIGALVVLVFALVAAVWWTLDAGSSNAPADPHSIAVLPFAVSSGDPGQAPLAAGMTDALIADLGRLDGLHVLSRTTTRRLADRQQPLRDLARDLGVTTVVEGSVQVSDSLIGIRVQLVDAASDRIRWSNHYEQPLRDVVTLQHDVAVAIAREIQASLSPAAEAHFATRPPVNPEAYRHYLWGLYERNREAPDAWRRSIEWLERSIALDSTYAPAYATLSLVLVHARGGGPPSRARELAERALQLDPSLPDAYVALGLYRELVAWEWDAAEEAFRTAIGLHPSEAEAHHELGLLLMRQRRFEEALPVAERALYLDPLSPRYLNGVAAVHLFAGRYAEAQTRLEQSLAMDGSNPATYWRLGMVHQQLGRHERAIEAFRRMIDLGGVQPMGHLGHALARAGQTAEAESLLAELPAHLGDPSDAHWLAANRALVYVGLGQIDTALDHLERAAELRSNLMVYLAVVPAWEPLRGHPRFEALMETVGLPSSADSRVADGFGLRSVHPWNGRRGRGRREVNGENRKRWV